MVFTAQTQHLADGNISSFASFKAKPWIYLKFGLEMELPEEVRESLR